MARELAAYRQFGGLLSKDRFDIIHSQVTFLKVDGAAQTLLQESETALEAERLRELEQERALAEAQRQRSRRSGASRDQTKEIVAHCVCRRGCSPDSVHPGCHGRICSQKQRKISRSP
ncbi:MAG: hypothetical protein IPK53_09275 [bacterium]|nr:hypothetical protein [bacterium]